MKLLHLHTNNYRNLDSDFAFDKNDGYISLIGLNGSGKSNLLEVVAGTFSMLYGTANQQFENCSVTYDIRGNTIRHNSTDKDIPKDDLPTNVIACYSGEDKRLWENCFKNYYIDFFNKAIAGGDYKPQMLYINKYCWSIALISLLFSEKAEVQSFLSDTLGIDTKTVQLKFTKRKINYNPHDASNWLEKVLDEQADGSMSIEVLKGIELNNSRYFDNTDDAIIFYYLYFLGMPDKNENEGLKADKIIEKIEIKLNGYDFAYLSEGQKKLILTECITHVLGDENSLILLDEPDAHAHIAMKKELLKSIEKFPGQTIFTTHSPMFLNKRWDGYKENNIFFIKNGTISDTKYLASISELSDNTIDYFDGAFLLSSKNILVVEGQYDKWYLEKAISVFSKKDEKYQKLHNISIIPQGSASHTKTFFQQVIEGMMDHLTKVVFLFDYDDKGYEGWKMITGLKKDKVSSIFYQHNDGKELKPTTKPSNKDYILVEDLFSPEAYKRIIDRHHLSGLRTHKDFRLFTDKISSEIKTYLETHYLSFDDDFYSGFQPIMDRVLEIFNLL